jgi:hypothetical protein
MLFRIKTEPWICRRQLLDDQRMIRPPLSEAVVILVGQPHGAPLYRFWPNLASCQSHKPASVSSVQNFKLHIKGSLSSSPFLHLRATQSVIFELVFSKRPFCHVQHACHRLLCTSSGHRCICCSFPTRQYNCSYSSYASLLFEKRQP